MTTKYGHFCPVARALEKIGDKWSLLIVRDLLRKPQRFTDLKLYLTDITPRWLTLRLRELEEAGIVQRDRQPGRREVWYQLTPAGRDLAPVMETLAAWGIRHAMRPPLPGETIHPDLLMSAFAKSLNRNQKRVPDNTRWLIRFPKDAYSVSFQEDHWSERRGEGADPDLTIATSPETWATLATVAREERGRILEKMEIRGSPARVKEFMSLFGVKKHRDSEHRKEIR